MYQTQNWYIDLGPHYDKAQKKCLHHLTTGGAAISKNVFWLITAYVLALKTDSNLFDTVGGPEAEI